MLKVFSSWLNSLRKLKNMKRENNKTIINVILSYLDYMRKLSIKIPAKNTLSFITVLEPTSSYV